ncbi:hypothetical protein Sme01_13990 [Sphaerisporangium melleum]|uniref:Uncharacterized protein n=1 Tax=Sphaerisporangium melleum TaxID=321316 RepID=A0A917QUP9_9ACTN|nr:hypothetical protein GCM10007964_09600 [Sphaerisporangium melleum]GII68923.1 hypothetical protein Sme01_13990 [Sphaerisporangium melleum]
MSLPRQGQLKARADRRVVFHEEDAGHPHIMAESDIIPESGYLAVSRKCDTPPMGPRQ